MRVEYNFQFDECDVPCFSVEATEGPHKLFQLSTLVLNLIEHKKTIDVVFHSPNQSELPRKIESFKRILESAPHGFKLEFEPGPQGVLGGYHYCWLSTHARGNSAQG